MASSDPIVSKAIYSILSDDVNVTAIFGDKIFPVIVRDLTDQPPPYLVFTERSAEPLITKEGTYERDWLILEVAICGTSFYQTKQDAIPVKAALNGVSGVFDDVEIAKLRWENTLLPEFDEKANVWVETQRFRIWSNKN